MYTHHLHERIPEEKTSTDIHCLSPGLVLQPITKNLKINVANKDFDMVIPSQEVTENIIYRQ